MRVFITVLVLIFSLQSWTKADDIRDFEIEGMSIGDSLLDYLSEQEIKNNVSKLQTTIRKKKYYDVNIYKDNFETYETVQVALKFKDKKYIIHGLDGVLYFGSRINDCYKKQNEIKENLSSIFKNAELIERDIIKHPDDPTGETTTKDTFFRLKSKDMITIGCFNMSKKLEKEYQDQLRVSLWTEELNEWLATY